MESNNQQVEALPDLTDMSEDELQLFLETALIEVEEERMWEERRRKDKMSGFAGALQTKITERIAERQVVESRWLEDLRQYHGYYGSYFDPDRPLQTNSQTRQPPKVNITRNKCLIAMSQMVDLQFPGRDKNFSISPTPVPEFELNKNSTEPAADPASGQDTLGQEISLLLREASIRARKMEDVIFDQFTESNWGPESRESIRDMTILGTGVQKGPTIEATVRKKWNHEVIEGKSVSTFEYVVDNTPGVERVDPWYFYPDMQARHPENAEDSFELHPMNRKDLIKLAKHPMFDEDAIRELLESRPDDVMTSNLTARHSITGSDTFFRGRYQVWEYHGLIDDDIIGALGLENEELRDPLQGYFGEVWFCQNHILKVRLSALEGDTNIPYAFAQWEPDETTPFGFGIPFLVRDAQKVVNSTWRMIMDNSGLSAGPQLIINKDAVTPANGKWAIEPHKIWYSNEYGSKPEDNIFFFDVPSNTDELSAVLQMAIQFSESEASMPLIAQGADSSHQAATTATGLSMLLDATNVVQKRANKNWDDNITSVLVKRFYDWNMQYNQDPSIKGDYQIIARGSTDLMMRQMMSQDAATLITAAQQNPELNLVLRMDRLAKVFIESTNVDSEAIVKTEEEIEAAIEEMKQNQQPDPEILKIQMEQQKLQLETQKAQHAMAMKEMEVQLKEIAINNTYEQFVAQAQANVITEQNEREQLLIKLAAESEMSAQELLAKVGMDEKHEETKRLIAATDFTAKREENALRLRNMQTKKKGEHDSF